MTVFMCKLWYMYLIIKFLLCNKVNAMWYLNDFASFSAIQNNNYIIINSSMQN